MAGAAHEQRTPTRVYFAHSPATRLIKIGTSWRPRTRVQSIARELSIPVDLIGSIPGGFTEEAEWHQQFRAYRAHGEWFYRSPDLLRAIDAVLAIPEHVHQARRQQRIDDGIATIRQEWGAKREALTASLTEYLAARRLGPAVEAPTREAV